MSVGAFVGAEVGFDVGYSVGAVVGLAVGLDVGKVVGSKVGEDVGASVAVLYEPKTALPGTSQASASLATSFASFGEESVTIILILKTASRRRRLDDPHGFITGHSTVTASISTPSSCATSARKRNSEFSSVQGHSLSP